MHNRPADSTECGVLLNAPQKSAVEIQMRLLEHTLLDVQRLMCHTPEDGMLTRYGPVAASTCHRIDALIERMLAEIAVVVKEFALEPRVEHVGNHIQAQMAAAWSDLYDTLSTKLVRYGPVDPALRDTLDPHILALIDMTREIEQVAHGEPEGRALGHKSDMI